MTDFYDDRYDSTFECPNCGANVYEDSPRCPRCGEYVTNSSKSGVTRSWLFVLIVIILVVVMLWPFLTGVMTSI